MNTHIAIKAIFSLKHNAMPDEFYGWRMFESKKYYIAFRKEFFVVCNKSGKYNFEYAFNYDGEYVGVREEITASGIDDGYWLTLSTDTQYSQDVLCYKTKNKLIKVFTFPKGASVYTENHKGKPGDRLDPEKRKVEWYPKHGGKKSVYIYPDGTMKRAKKDRVPSYKELKKKMNDLRKKGALK